MENMTTKELYGQLQSRIVVDLKENETLCPECKGMHFVYRQEGNKGYINSCNHCYNGKVYVCKYCDKYNKTDYCDCKEASDERHINWELKQAEKDFNAYQKAEKINYKDYDGYYLLPCSEHLKEIDDVADWITDKLSDGVDVPEYLWAVEGQQHVSIDLCDVISDKCDDGYEDMFDYLNTDSPLLSQAQELINQWEKEQGDSLCVFTETYKKAVVIKDLVEEIRSELQNKI
jgi:hypothetical protein